MFLKCFSQQKVHRLVYFAGETPEGVAKEAAKKAITEGLGTEKTDAQTLNSNAEGKIDGIAKDKGVDAGKAKEALKKNMDDFKKTAEYIGKRTEAKLIFDSKDKTMVGDAGGLDQARNNLKTLENFLKLSPANEQIGADLNALKAPVQAKIDEIHDAIAGYYDTQRKELETRVGINRPDVKIPAIAAGPGLPLALVGSMLPEMKFKGAPEMKGLNDKVKLDDKFKDQAESEEGARMANVYFSQLNTLRTDLMSAKDDYTKLSAAIDAETGLTADKKTAQKTEIGNAIKLIDAQIKSVDDKITGMEKEKPPIKVSADYLVYKKEAEKQILDAALQKSGDLQTKVNAELMKINPELIIPATNADGQKAIAFAYNQLKAQNPRLCTDADTALSSWREQQQYFNGLDKLQGTKVGLPPDAFDAKTGALIPDKLRATWDKTSGDMGVDKGGKDANGKEIKRPSEPSADLKKTNPAEYAKQMAKYRRDYSAYQDQWYGEAGKMGGKENPWPPKGEGEKKQEAEQKVKDDAALRAEAKNWVNGLDLGKEGNYKFSNEYQAPHSAERAVKSMLESIYISQGKEAGDRAFNAFLAEKNKNVAKTVEDYAKVMGVDQALVNSENVVWFNDGQTRGYVVGLMASADSLGDQKQAYQDYVNATLKGMQPKMMETWTASAKDQVALDSLHTLVVGSILTPKDWKASLDKPVAKKVEAPAPKVEEVKPVEGVAANKEAVTGAIGKLAFTPTDKPGVTTASMKVDGVAVTITREPSTPGSTFENWRTKVGNVDLPIGMGADTVADMVVKEVQKQKAAAPGAPKEENPA